MNVPGDFYVEDRCCTSCAMPFTEAPGHFEYHHDGHCFVSKQPSSPEETERMAYAIQASELSCIRYAGGDPATLRKLVELGEGGQCDQLEAPVESDESKPRVWWARWLRN
jgi:ferredoxin